MNTILRRRQGMMGQKSGYLTGYTVVGSPTIVNGVMTPNDTGWITTPQSFDPGDKTWELVFCIKRTVNIRWQNIISGNMMLQGNSSIINLYLRSANSSSFDIAVGSPSHYINGDIYTWVKIGFDGSKYYYSVSTNGETYSQKTTNTTALLIKPGVISFGAKASNTETVTAEYDLTQMQISIDGKLWWKAVE